VARALLWGDVMIRLVPVVAAFWLMGCGPEDVQGSFDPGAAEQELGVAPPSKVLSIQWQGQQTGYWCGPGSTRMALSARISPPSQATLAAYLPTTMNGTDDISLVAHALNHYLDKSFYAASNISDPPSSAQQTALQKELVGTISNGYAMVGNVVSGWRPPGYPSGTIYHYVAIVGYDQSGARARIADPAGNCAAGGSWCNVPQQYWVSTHDLAVWISPKGYTKTGLPPTGGTPPNGTLTGAIYTGASTSNRVAGAVVTVEGHSMTTGADGLYTFSLAPGTYTASVTKAGFGTASVSRAVTSGGTTWGSMEVSPVVATGTVKGKIYVAPDVNQPIAGAIVTVGGKSMTTGDDGIYSFELPAGDHTVNAAKAGYSNGAATRTVVAGQTIWGSIGLTKAAAAEIVAPVLAISSPVSGHVQLAEVTFAGTATGVDEVKVGTQRVPVVDGRWSIDLKLIPGENALTVLAVDAQGNVSQAFATVTFDAGLIGVVHLDGDETAAISAAQVTLSNESGAKWATQTDATGAFSFDVAPGAFTLSIEASGYLSYHQAISVPDDQRFGVTVAMSPGVDQGGTQRDTQTPAVTSPDVGIDQAPAPANGGCAAAAGPALMLLAVTVLRRRRS
jgi:hypothetical protein